MLSPFNSIVHSHLGHTHVKTGNASKSQVYLHKEANCSVHANYHVVDMVAFGLDLVTAPVLLIQQLQLCLLEYS